MDDVPVIAPELQAMAADMIRDYRSSEG